MSGGFGWSRDDAPEDSREDWLAEQGGLDWTEPRGRARSAESTHEVARPAGRSVDRGRRARDAEPAAGRPANRRLGILAVGALLALAAIVALAIVANRGGNAKHPAAAATTQTQPTVGATSPATTSRSPAPPAARGASGATGAATTPSRILLPASGVLQSGDNGPLVVRLQKALAALGLKVGAPDGTFGPATKAAVVAFQSAHGLSPDGIVGATTAAKIDAALKTAG